MTRQEMYERDGLWGRLYFDRYYNPLTQHVPPARYAWMVGLVQAMVSGSLPLDVGCDVLKRLEDETGEGD